MKSISFWACLILIFCSNLSASEDLGSFPDNYQGNGLEVQYEEPVQITGTSELVRPPLIISDYSHVLVFGVAKLTQGLKDKLDANNYTAVAVDKMGNVARVENVAPEDEIIGQGPVILSGLYLFDYRKIPEAVGVGPYNETILTAAVVDESNTSPQLKDVKYFIWDIKVSDGKAIRAGRRLWNFPKTAGVTEVFVNDKKDWVFRLSASGDYQKSSVELVCSGCAKEDKDSRIGLAGTQQGDALGINRIADATLVTPNNFDKNGSIIPSYVDMNSQGSKLAFRSYCQISYGAVFSAADGDQYKLDPAVTGAKAFAEKLSVSRFTPLKWQIGTQCEYSLGLDKNREKTIFLKK